jgi:hypothetical protein
MRKFYCLGVQADQRVLRQLLMNFLPSMDTLLRDHDIELSLIALPWYKNDIQLLLQLIRTSTII